MKKLAKEGCEQIERLKGQIAVFSMGKTGAGKSLLTRYLLGDKIVPCEDM